MYAFNALEGTFDLVSAVATPPVVDTFNLLTELSELLLCESGDELIWEA